MKQSADMTYSHHGDLTSASSSYPTSSSAHSAPDCLGTVHRSLSFVIPDDGETPMAKLGERLELAVGGGGVIGKMVSVTRGGLEFGDGIIGWN